VEETTPCNY